MGYQFDGPNKIIQATIGTVLIEVADLYSRWKDWLATDDNAKYLPALSVVGGDPIPSGYLGSTFFLENGWKIRPDAVSHTLTVSGNLFTRDGSAPVIAASGSYNVLVVMTVSNLIDTLAVGSGMSVDEHNKLMAVPTAPQNADAVWTYTR